MKTLGIIFSNIHDKDVSELTAMRTLASVPFGGRYRLIDFVLSNMVNSGILNIGVITKYNYQSLMEHIGSGKSWDLSRKNGGITILPPFGTETAKVYSSRFEAISNASYFLRKATETYVVMSDCDNVCNIDFSDVLQYHIAKHADITVVYRQKEIVPGDTKVRTALTIDGDGRVTKVVTGGRHRGVINSFTNMLIMSRQFLLNIIDSSAENGFTSFSRDVLIKGVDDMRIYGYKHCGYFGSIDSLPNYFKHSMQLLEKPVREELFRKNGAGIYTKVQDSAPLRLEEGSDAKNSLIADGCVIKGKVYNSILFRGVKVEKGAEVSNSIIFQDVTIGENSSLNCVISDSGVKVLENRRLSGHETHPYYITKNTTI